MNIPGQVTIIDPQQFGVSFSLKQCRNFGIDGRKTMQWLIGQAGFRRFRLMSYWNDHERQPDVFDFSQLDWQMEMAKSNGCLVTLCLGARQPRWPENHWPGWAWELPKAERTNKLLVFIQRVVERYRGYDNIVSYQLENEALLKNFGERPDIDRQRLRREYALVKQLDPKRPIIMSTSNSWGIPLRRPIPDIVGFSYYRTMYRKGRYTPTLHTPLLDRARALGIGLLHHKPSFIHELQLEPWGPAAIWNMTVPEQDKSMSAAAIRTNVAVARKTKLRPIDIWGGEWWYWRLDRIHDPSIWLAVSHALKG